MKAILYAGAVLMTGASIYGFIDYKKTSRDKAFTTMYKTEEGGTAVEKTSPVIETKSKEEKKEIVSLKKYKPVIVNKKSGKVIPVAEEKKPGNEVTKMTI